MNDPFKLLISTLKDMAGPEHFRSQSARLRYLYPVIEKAFSDGLSRSAVLEALSQAGIELSMMSFDKALYRIRKSIRAGGGPTSTRAADLPSASSVARELHGEKIKPAQTEIEPDQEEIEKEAFLRRERLKKHPFYHLSERNNPDWKNDGRLHNSVPDKEKLYGKEGEE